MASGHSDPFFNFLSKNALTPIYSLFKHNFIVSKIEAVGSVFCETALFNISTQNRYV